MLKYGGSPAGLHRYLEGRGFKANHYDVETGAGFWFSGCRKDGADRRYGERIPVEIDEDVREEYRGRIRGNQNPPG